MVVIATGDHRRHRDGLRWNCLSKAWQRGDPDPRSMRVDRGFFVSGVRSVFLWKTDLTPRAAVSTKVDIHQQQRGTVEGGVGPVAGVSAAWMPRPGL
ncbi:hypothetical protein JY418_13995, partial [Stenotrophomonas maltophilia]|nr:hypothetical protein [Stenotrophomonas maltophilia]